MEEEGKLLVGVGEREMVKDRQHSTTAKTHVIPHNQKKEFAYNIHPSWVLHLQHLISVDGA